MWFAEMKSNREDHTGRELVAILLVNVDFDGDFM